MINRQNALSWMRYTSHSCRIDRNDLTSKWKFSTGTKRDVVGKQGNRKEGQKDEGAEGKNRTSHQHLI